MAKLPLEIIAPKGWRFLKKGEFIRRGDRYADTVQAIWKLSSAVGAEAFSNSAPHKYYIRKAAKGGA